MIPPPENEYESREDLLSAAQSWALGHGYAVTIKRSVAEKTYNLNVIVAVQTCSKKKKKTIDNESSY